MFNITFCISFPIYFNFSTLESGTGNPLIELLDIIHVWGVQTGLNSVPRPERMRR